MSKKEEVNTSKNNKKKKTIIAILAVVLLAIVIFLIWFFNRKFDVTFDLNNGTNDNVVKVKYNKVINNDDIKTKEELGESFIDWYEVIGEEDGKDVLADKSYDFTTKIKKDVKLKAVYTGKVETITISFDSKGGSKVDDIIINKGAELKLPKNPTYSGYNFVSWEYKSGKVVSDKTKFNEDTTLYAKWEKVAEKTTKPVTTTTTTTTAKKEETISLSLNRKAIHRNGVKELKATAKVENGTGEVTYSIDNEACVDINSKTGHIEAHGNNYNVKNYYANKCQLGKTITVTATSASGKTAKATFALEGDLALTTNGKTYTKNDSDGDILTSAFEVTSNIDVTWKGECASTSYKNCSYAGELNKYSKKYTGTFYVQADTMNGQEKFESGVKVTGTTDGGQSISLRLTRKVN